MISSFLFIFLILTLAWVYSLHKKVSNINHNTQQIAPVLRQISAIISQSNNNISNLKSVISKTQDQWNNKIVPMEQFLTHSEEILQECKTSITELEKKIREAKTIRDNATVNTPVSMLNVSNSALHIR